MSRENRVDPDGVREQCLVAGLDSSKAERAIDRAEGVRDGVSMPVE